ncbi:HTH-type transcriptional activator Btr [termite gut metagenome]|uniref:HTH-type transcriptional activator Btr n=1 Tax=termite gut metagenome TaxID=433724 RepID=A0A5J4SZC0_9ZZZZ
MLKEYTLSDLLLLPSKHIAYYAGTIETMKEPEVEWPYRQSFYSVAWFVQGNGFHVIDFNEYQIRKGRMFLVNPNQINNWSYVDNCKGYILMFAKSLASQLGIEFLKPYIDVEKQDASLLGLVFENLIKDCKLGNDDLQHKIMTSIQYFYSLIANKVHDEAFTSKNTAIFRQFKELILTNDFKIQSVDKYADTLHISTAVLNIICQNLSGVSAKQLLLDLKLTEAKRLLLYSKLNINEISFQLGFEDSSYFARIFKKKALLSPSLFQRKYRK